MYNIIYLCNNAGRNKCNNKTPLNYDRGTLYLLFTFYLQIRTKKPYTKTVIKHIYRITIWNNMLNILQTSTCQGIIRNEIILLNLI